MGSRMLTELQSPPPPSVPRPRIRTRLTARHNGPARPRTVLSPVSSRRRPEKIATATQVGEFERADQNGDGVIDKAEFESYMTKKREFEQADTNGDGVIDQAEFER